MTKFTWSPEVCISTDQIYNMKYWNMSPTYSYIKVKCVLILYLLRIKRQDIFVISSN